MMNNEVLRVCYFGTYRANYSRNRIMLTGLERNGVEVTPCHEALWHSVEDRVQQVSGGWRRPRFWWRILRVYGKLLYRFFRHQPEFDVMVVGYPGQFDVFLARLLCWWRGKPLVWDIFMSIYLITCERSLEHKSPLIVKGLRFIEKLACRLPEGLIIDTDTYATWLGKTHDIARTRFHLVPTGADSDTFQPTLAYQAAPAKSQTEIQPEFQIIYYGTFIPNHGVLTIIEAAKLLADQLHIRFTLIGEGPDHASAIGLAQQHHLENVDFCGWLSQESIHNLVMNAPLCLGVFGTTPQSLMTVQNKIYECMAMERPVLSGESATVRAAFEHGKHLYLCERDNPQALAQAILFLVANPQDCAEMARNGRLAYQANYTVEKIGAQFKQHLLEIIG